MKDYIIHDGFHTLKNNNLISLYPLTTIEQRDGEITKPLQLHFQLNRKSP